jgi:phosphoribosylglycinamide formyltransferase-1
MLTSSTSLLPKRIVLFASGGGSNAEAVIKHFAGSTEVKVAAVFCNKAGAGVLDKVAAYQVPSFLFNRAELNETGVVEQKLIDLAPDLIVLAGFLWLMPASIVERFAGKIINIHPALLPNYGGKGMHGQHCHAAVLAAGEKQSGMTIHYVNPEYDKGDLILQAYCPVKPADTPEVLAARVLQLEHYYLPRVIEQLCLG